MKYATSLLTALLLAPSAFAAVLAVLPGESIQAKVDLAQPGDIVAIFGGTYAQDVTVYKPIRLTEVDGEDVTITGNVTFDAVTNAPPFEGFVAGSPGKGLIITNTTGIALKNIDARPGIGLLVNWASKASVVGGFYSKIEQDGGELTTSLTQVTGSFDTTINAQKTVAFRTIIGGSATWKSKRAWLDYSQVARYLDKVFSFEGTGCKVVLVGCVFEGNGTFGGMVSFGGSSNKVSLTNSIIRGALWGYNSSSNWGQACVNVSVSNEAFIVNNYFSSTLQGGSDYYSSGPAQGVGVYSNGGACTVINNIFRGQFRALNLPYGATVRNNLLWNMGAFNPIIGGVITVETVTADPLFVLGQEPTLQPASPCVNAGINDPIYNDLNDTRNDIGPGGGCLFDPNGWTTTNPVVISFDIAPQQLLRGVDSQVNISNGQAVSLP